MIETKYKKETASSFKEKFGISNVLEVPKIIKVVVSSGVGSLVHEEGRVEAVEKSLALITGQKPSRRPAKKAVASFKTRQGMTVGLMVTLRGKRMYNFLERLINVAIPRMRDFRGINPESIDERGSLNLGFKEHIIFPEMIEEDTRGIFGLQVTIVTNAGSREKALELFRLSGFPFSKKQ